MFVIFNKEYRKIKNILSELSDKMKKSINIEQVYEKNAEIYKLDSVDIVIAISEHKIIVKDKSGAVIISIDCHYDISDELQNAKNGLFCGFIRQVRDTYEKRIDKANKFKVAAEKAKKEEEAKQKIVSARLAKEKLLSDALDKIRGL